MRYILWDFYQCKQIDFSKMPDREFRVQFEQEWQILCGYREHFYGFSVVPKLSLPTMERYQKLAKGAQKIRREISVYLTHQATEYPHWIKTWAPNFTEVAFERRVRASYEALVKSLAKTAVRNLTASSKDRSGSENISPSRQQLQNDIEAQLWEQYDAARQEFSFYWDYPGKQRPIGKMGLVDFPQDSESRDKLEAVLKQIGLPYGVRDFSEIGFAHYIQDRLRRWVKATYSADAPQRATVSIDATPVDGGPTLGETLSGDSSCHFNDNEIGDAKPAVIGTDGIPYITIHQASERSGLTVFQLRRLDKQGFLSSVRVKEVCQKPYPLNSDVRLYPLTPEGDHARQAARARLEKHSSQLKGEEIDRQTAAKIVGVSVATLRKWEDKGRIQPRKKGKIVVYDSAALEQAVQIKTKNNQVDQSGK